MRSALMYVLFGGFALGLALLSGFWGVAALYDIPAERVLAAWQDPVHPQPPDSATWEMVVDYLHMAKELEPGKALHWILLARLHHHQALTLPLWDEQSIKLFDKAESYYRHALKLRPSWGDGWINLAQVQVQRGQIAPETVLAMQRALVMSPESAPVQRMAMRLGFGLWSMLDAKGHQEILSVVERLMPEQGEWVLVNAKLYGHLLTIRPVVTKFPEWQVRLEKMLKEEGRNG